MRRMRRVPPHLYEICVLLSLVLCVAAGFALTGFTSRAGDLSFYGWRAPQPFTPGRPEQVGMIFAVVFLITALLPLVRTLELVVSFVRRLGKRREARRGLCPSCGYDLRESPERCPECGMAVKTV